MGVNELTTVRDVIRVLVEDRGGVMPAWSIPQGAYNYICAYCGESASMNFNERIFMEHKPDCPIGIGQRLIDKFDNDQSIRDAALKAELRLIERDANKERPSNESFLAVARDVFPDKTDDERWSIVLSYTGFPSFFIGDPLEACRQQLIDYRDGKWSDEDFDGDDGDAGYGHTHW